MNQMRATTYVHIAFRNVGDSQDLGQYHEGTVSECILWVAQQIASKSMASRFTIGIGRDKADAARGIEVKGAGQFALDTGVKSMLDSVFNGTANVDDFMPTQKLEGDDYVA
jgi:hypothetical protein